MATLMLALGTRPLVALPASAVATFVIAQAFGDFVMVPLPRGVLSMW